MSTTPLLESLQRVVCKALVNDLITTNVLGPPPPSGGNPTTHAKVAAMLVGEYGKLPSEMQKEGAAPQLAASGELYKLVNGFDTAPTTEGPSKTEEDAECDINWANMQRIVSVLAANRPDAVQRLVQEGRAARAKSLATAEATREVTEAMTQGTPSDPNAPIGFGEDDTMIPASAERPPQLVSGKELRSLQQQVKAGVLDPSVLVGLRDEAKEAPIEIEINTSNPSFLQGLARKNRINYRAAPVNLAEQRDAEITAKKTSNSMADIAEKRAQGNAARARDRAIARREREAAAIAAAEEEGPVIIEGTAGEDRLLDKDLDESPEEQGGVRKAADVKNLPPWLRASLGEEVSFGPQSQGLSIQEQRRRLPVYAVREQIIQYVKSHTVTVLQGETGSGKTTQIPQFLLESILQKDDGMIAVTQPRRMAAMTLAERVAEERGCQVGEEVGYTVRFTDQTSPLTRIKYMTDGMLLREALLDDTFGRYSVIILDEAHERSINTDVLLGVVKKAVRKRPTLKVIIMSATIEIDKFRDYFGATEAFSIQGRTHPVTTHFAPNPVEDYVTEAVSKAMYLHITKPPGGDILVFLTGHDEIEDASERIHRQYELLLSKLPPELPQEKRPQKMLILPCYATLPGEALSKVTAPAPPGHRKVIFSTNVAETSITIDGLRYVVDCGYCKQHVYDPVHNVDSLKIVPVSRAQADQRKGRAGRTAPGECYRLYTEGQFLEEMTEATVPEIQRTNLANVVLSLKAIGIDDLFDFDFVDPPPQETLVMALQKLRYLGALDDDGSLTAVGRRMSALPLQPSESKTLITALDSGCAPSVLIIVSLLSMKNIFVRPKDKQGEADDRRRFFAHPDGDQLTLLNVYQAWKDAGRSDTWCRSNFINPRALSEGDKTREQLFTMLAHRYRSQLEVDTGDTVDIRKAIVAGYFFQVAKRTEGTVSSTNSKTGSSNPNGTYVTMADRREVFIHPSSALYNRTPRYMVYHELVLTTKEYMRECMVVNPQWLVELAPAYYSAPREGELTKEQKAQRLNPMLKPWEDGNSWRLSKQLRRRK